jgi:hypothetical protein
MALPNSEHGPDDRSVGEKRKAYFKLIVTVLAIDTIAVLGYLVLVFTLGGDATATLLPLVVMSVITGLCFQRGKQEIGL